MLPAYRPRRRDGPGVSTVRYYTGIDDWSTRSRVDLFAVVPVDGVADMEYSVVVTSRTPEKVANCYINAILLFFHTRFFPGGIFHAGLNSIDQQ